jgi:hypothetical protein
MVGDTKGLFVWLTVDALWDAAVVAAHSLHTAQERDEEGQERAEACHRGSVEVCRR